MLMSFGLVFDGRIFELLASGASAVALWAHTRAARAQDPTAALTARLRHPVRWTLLHPLAALRRRVQ